MSASTENPVQNPAQKHYKLAQAANIISESLGLPAGSVSIGVGELQKYGELPRMGEEEAKSTHIVITASGLGASIDPAGAEKAFLAGIAKIPALRQIVQTESNEELAAEVYSKLQPLTTDKHLLNWSGFNPDVVKNNWNVGDHAIPYVSNNPYGIEFSINVPTGANNDNPDVLIEKVDENIKARLPEIKALLTEKTIKYITGNLQKEGKTEAEIEEAVSKAKTDMEQLNISVNKDGGSISVVIRSPAQEEAIKANGNKWDSPNNADELKATNPLNELTNSVTEHEKQENPDASPQLHKTLGRAFLYAGGEKAMEVFSFIAGRRDIYNAIKKEAKNSPERAAEFGQLLSSDLFKKQDWIVNEGEAGKAPAKPAFRQDPHKLDSLELWIETPKKDVRKTIEALATMGQQVEAPPPSAIAPENFKKDGNWLENLLNKIMPASRADVRALQREQQAAFSR